MGSVFRQFVERLLVSQKPCATFDRCLAGDRKVASMSVQNTSSQPYFLQANEGEAIWYTAARMTLKATSESTGGALSLVEGLAPPDFAPPWHVHRRDDEMFSILDGSFLFQCGDNLFEGGPGPFVFLPRDIPHNFKNVGATPPRF